MTNFLKRFVIFLLFVPGVPLLSYYVILGKETSVLMMLIICCLSGVFGYICTGCFPWLNEANSDSEKEPLFNGFIYKRPSGSCEVADRYVIKNGYIEYIESGMFIKVTFPYVPGKIIILDAADTTFVGFESSIEKPEYKHEELEYHSDGEHKEFCISNDFDKL